MTDAPSPHCLVCGSARWTLRYRLTRFRVLGCDDCEQVYLDPLPSPEEIRRLFESLYTTGEGSVPELKEYYAFTYEDAPDNPLVQQYEVWLDKIEETKRPGRVLDIGCGTGLFLSVARRRGWEPFGVDESIEATSHARDHFGLDPWVGEFETFSAEGKDFDLITGWDVIEHSRDPVALMRSARRCLAPGGVVALSTPNQHSILDLIAGWIYALTFGGSTKALEKFYIEQHFLYFTPESLGRCLARADLAIARMDRELTDLRRLTLSPVVRLGIQAMFMASHALRRENRIFAIAQAAEA